LSKIELKLAVMSFSIFILLANCMDCVALDNATLGKYRSRFVNERVFVNKNFTQDAHQLIGWHFAKYKKGRFEVNPEFDVPPVFAGRAGMIVAIQAQASLDGGPVDQSDNASVDSADALVHLDSGEYLATTLSATDLISAPGDHAGDTLCLASVREEHHKTALTLGDMLHGKSLYLSNLTRIYNMGLMTSNIEELKAGVGSNEAQIVNFPLLTPLPVLETRYSVEQDFTSVVLQLPDGRKAQYIVGCVDEIAVSNLACASITMPDFLTTDEIVAIRKGTIFIGMSEPALYMTMGFPQKTKNSTVGDSQLVYAKKLVYVDSVKHVSRIEDN